MRVKRRFFKCSICELVTVYLATHFANKHGIPRSSKQIERYMLLAKAYEGKDELKYNKSTKPSNKIASQSRFQRLFNLTLGRDTKSNDDSYDPSADEEDETSDECEVIPPTPDCPRRGG